jgi:hypothetical protein
MNDDTPRTEAKLCPKGAAFECVDADFARELERENARMRESLDHIRDYGMTMTKEAIVGEASRFHSA